MAPPPTMACDKTGCDYSTLATCRRAQPGTCRAGPWTTMSWRPTRSSGCRARARAAGWVADRRDCPGPPSTPASLKRTGPSLSPSRSVTRGPPGYWVKTPLTSSGHAPLTSSQDRLMTPGPTRTPVRPTSSPCSSSAVSAHRTGWSTSWPRGQRDTGASPCPRRDWGGPDIEANLQVHLRSEDWAWIQDAHLHHVSRSCLGQPQLNTNTEYHYSVLTIWMVE